MLMPTGHLSALPSLCPYPAPASSRLYRNEVAEAPSCAKVGRYSNEFACGEFCWTPAESSTFHHSQWQPGVAVRPAWPNGAVRKRASSCPHASTAWSKRVRPQRPTTKATRATGRLCRGD